MVLSPSLMQMLPPCLKVCFKSKGSRMGSKSSPMFSSSTGVPNWMQFSRVRTKSESVSLMTCRFLALSMFLIHLLAWPCGSIISGHLRALLEERKVEDSESFHEYIYV